MYILCLFLLVPSILKNAAYAAFTSTPGTLTGCTSDSVQFNWVYDNPSDANIASWDYLGTNILSFQQSSGNVLVGSAYTGRATHISNGAFTLGNVTSGDTGQYQCTVTYISNPTARDTATLTVYEKVTQEFKPACIENSKVICGSGIDSSGITFGWEVDGESIPDTSQTIEGQNGAKNYTCTISGDRVTNCLDTGVKVSSFVVCEFGTTTTAQTNSTETTLNTTETSTESSTQAPTKTETSGPPTTTETSGPPTTTETSGPPTTTKTSGLPTTTKTSGPPSTTEISGPPSTTETRDLPDEVIIGVSVASVTGLILIIVIIVFLRLYLRKRSKSKSEKVAKQKVNLNNIEKEDSLKPARYPFYINISKPKTRMNPNHTSSIDNRDMDAYYGRRKVRSLPRTPYDYNASYQRPTYHTTGGKHHDYFMEVRNPYTHYYPSPSYYSSQPSGKASTGRTREHSTYQPHEYYHGRNYPNHGHYNYHGGQFNDYMRRNHHYSQSIADMDNRQYEMNWMY